MAKSNTALGIDISEAAIHMTLLRKSQEGLQLVKAASTSVPAGAVKDGNVEDPALLSRAIRQLKRRNNI
ncbi:MAG: pilus assembly protein PilM, partial [Planctomycetota bacterium]